MTEDSKPIVLITGDSGAIGSSLAETLKHDYHIVGIDQDVDDGEYDEIAIDLADDASVDRAFEEFRERFGDRIASVVHLAAYFDFTGEDNPLYETVNIEGTRRLLRKLQEFDVGQFLYSSTMLVHEAVVPGERIDERQPIAPKWAYPISKARTEAVIREEHGKIPFLVLRLAGVYDDVHAVPTLSHQIARIYQREMKANFYAGDLRAGQSMIHLDDMIDAFVRAIDRRDHLPPNTAILVGEEDAMGYQALQTALGRLIHGSETWPTVSLPKPVARIGAAAEVKAEPLVPDDLDRGEKPFIRPFMIEMADDHYALDTRRAEELLGWRPKHSLKRTLPRLVRALKEDPAGWYRENGINPPDWLEMVAERTDDPDALRSGYERQYEHEHRQNLWAHFFNIALGTWLVTSPPILGYESGWMTASDVLSGLAIMLFGFVSLSWKHAWARWACAAVGTWVMFAPLAFWSPLAAGYLNGTIVGALVFAFAVATRPTPGVAPHAAMTGPTIPPGWSFCPSSWFQRAPIIILAFIGFYISRHLTAYQLGHIDSAFEPFFAGGPDPKNGTEEITTSSVSEWWPVPDAGLGAFTYALEILTGIVGSSRRWRTMPWLVLLFGIMIVPLGFVSISFIIIQPVMLGTWCTLCLIGAAAMLIQIPYSFDEIVATSLFLWRRWKKGRPILRVLFFGDTDEGDWDPVDDNFRQSPGTIARDLVGGGVNMPWNLGVSLALGAWLMATRGVLGSEGWMANMEHIVGSLVLTVTVTALAEVARPVRYVNALLAAVLIATPLFVDTTWLSTANAVVCGAALIWLCRGRGRVSGRYGGWNRLIV